MNANSLEERLRACVERYHDKHPFHRLMVEGRLSKGQIQAWALNRYCYQASLPRKDALLLARFEEPHLRAAWRRRLEDQDGETGGEGGIARWLHLTDVLGLDRDLVTSQRAALPATRFAVEAYGHFVAERSLLEAVASSLTELFAPQTIATRISALLAHYDFIDREALAYFDRRLTEAPRDSSFALAYVIERAHTPAQQEAVVQALRFKCHVLWAQLDALYYAYVAPGFVPHDAFQPEAP